MWYLWLMAISTQLFRFKIELADITRSTYESLDFRVAQHPSETVDYLLTRVIAYALNYQDHLHFSAEGLHTPEDPCLSVPSTYGGQLLWIEIGNPSAKKLHKAAKASKTVKVYTYKNPKVLVEEMIKNNVHKAQDIEIYALTQEFLEKLAQHLERETQWTLTHNDGSIIINCNSETIEGELMQVNS